MKFEKAILALFAAVLFPVIPVLAQGPLPLPQEMGAAGSVVTLAAQPFFFSFGGGGDTTVAGAPFSAQEVTNSNQNLSDGNQINRNNTVQIYRDSAGRVRREMKLSMIGPWSVSGTPKQIILIADPVNQVRYFLQPDKKLAYKMPFQPEGGNLAYKTTAGGEMIYKRTAGGKVGSMTVMEFSQQRKPQTQSLGVQMIQGLEAQGTEETFTTPAGAIGNQKPIVSTTEKWYSPDLQTYVLIKRTDPRFGNTSFQLENISRNEPAASLFQVPPGYTVQDGPPQPPKGGAVILKSTN
ncbi:MAG: hypothetical protein ACRD2O_06905 [Terriglobia bacterium]